MPELPDITVYIEALSERLLDQRLNRVELKSPFLLRTVSPSLEELIGKRVRSFARLGKRIAIGFEADLWLVLHLMIAGRLHWHTGDKRRSGGRTAAVFEFDAGTLFLTEAGTQKRASLHVVGSQRDLVDHDPGGIDVLAADFREFRAALTRENHTLKRALTDPTILSGIGNAYSDEILHRAKLSPVALTTRLSDDELARLHAAVQATLEEWVARLRAHRGSEFPEHVTAFRDGMAVHGRYGKPCPECGTTVQRIRYASNETNYCPRCQTGGKLLADRSLSRLLKSDWPRTVDELEKRRGGRR
jgi:formamidopyrimidine-DNA glycosylase